MFRDDTGLSVTPALWDSIAAALGESNYFILLASPEAAASEWVEREIRFWLEHRGADRILPVVTDGEWLWDERRSDLDFERSTAAPAALRGAFEQEPRHLDLRWAHDAAALDLRNGRFRDAVADLAAPIHGKPKDELEGEDLRQARKSARLRRAAIAGLTALAATTTAGGVLAFLSRQEAIAQTEVAERRTRLAQAQRLATESGSLLDAFEPARALVAALQALQTTRVDGEYVTAAETRLYESLALLGHDDRFDEAPLLLIADPGEKPPPLILSVAFAPGGCRLAAGGVGSRAHVWETCVDHSLGPTIDRFLETGEVDWESRTIPYFASEGRGSVLAVAISPDARTIAMGGVNGGLQLHDLEVGEKAGHRLRELSLAITSVAFSPDGRWLATGDAEGVVQVWSPADPTREPAQATRPGKPITSVAFSPDGSRLGSAALDGTVRLWETSRLDAAPRALKGHDGPVYALAFGDRDRLATGGRDGTVRLWDLRSPADDPQVLSTRDAVTSLAFGDGPRWLAAGSRSGTIRLWDTARPGASPRILVGHTRLVSSLAFDAKGKRLASSSYDGAVRLWPLSFEDLIRRVCRELPTIVSAAGVDFTGDKALAAAGFDLELMSDSCSAPVADRARRLAELSAIVPADESTLDKAIAAYRLSFTLGARNLRPDTEGMKLGPEQLARNVAAAAAADVERRRTAGGESGANPPR